MKIIEIIHTCPIKSSIIIYLLITIIILILKPRTLFDNNGKSKQFGIGLKNKTILPIWLVFLLIAIFSYYFTVIIKIFY